VGGNECKHKHITPPERQQWLTACLSEREKEIDAGRAGGRGGREGRDGWMEKAKFAKLCAKGADAKEVKV
jgi:hypothetical protein